MTDTTHAKTMLASLMLALISVVSFVAAQTSTGTRETKGAVDPAKEQRLKWFREAKYGLFIHWGLYAIPAGEWNGRAIPGLGEWIMFRTPVPVKQYELLASRFNPVKYNADEWVQLAQDAGMKYIVITSKHHDGFALFKSKASPYNVVDATPFRRDVLGGAGGGVRPPDAQRGGDRVLPRALSDRARADADRGRWQLSVGARADETVRLFALQPRCHGDRLPDPDDR